MKTAKYIFILIFILGMNMTGSAQVKLPTIMIFPSDKWCNERGYWTDGAPDYNRAMLEDPDLRHILNTIGKMLQKDDIKTKDLEFSLKGDNRASALRATNINKRTGAGVVEHPRDQILRSANPEIIVMLDWSVGAGKEVSFDMTALDAFSQQPFAFANGASPGSPSSTMHKLLEQAVLNHIAEFNSELKEYFDSMITKGRAVAVFIDIREQSDLAENKDGFFTEFGDQNLNEIVKDWVAENSVGKAAYPTSSSENSMEFELVRIPLYEEKTGNPFRAYDWGRQLSKMLSSQYQIKSRVEEDGVGRVIITIE